MISTHILDTTKGAPAAGVQVLLEKRQDEGWNRLGIDKTNVDGRIVFDCPKEVGVYRLTFFVEDYFKQEEFFFMNTPVVFHIKSIERKYHVPLLLNPYGYSTYRGS
jgi:5-hydroxyisourate hydrolase